jgi:hypothetical protein
VSLEESVGIAMPSSRVDGSPQNDQIPIAKRSPNLARRQEFHHGAVLPEGCRDGFRHFPGRSMLRCVRDEDGARFDHPATVPQAGSGRERRQDPGDVYSIPPGHDAWVIGDEPARALDWAPADDSATNQAVEAARADAAN